MAYPGRYCSWLDPIIFLFITFCPKWNLVTFSREGLCPGITPPPLIPPSFFAPAIYHVVVYLIFLRRGFCVGIGKAYYAFYHEKTGGWNAPSPPPPPPPPRACYIHIVPGIDPEFGLCLFVLHACNVWVIEQCVCVKGVSTYSKQNIWQIFNAPLSLSRDCDNKQGYWKNHL